MVHVRFINDQETVVTVPVRPDVDRWVLAVMPVKIKLELLRDTLGVNGGRDTDAAFTQHEQDRFVHIVVDKHDRTPGRLYQIGSELVRIENLAVIKMPSPGARQYAQKNLSSRYVERQSFQVLTNVY